MNVFAQIQNLCEERGIKIRQLEQQSGIGNGVIAKWKKSSPQVDSLSKVAKYFNVSLDYLAERTDVKNFDNYSEQAENEVQELEVLVKSLLNELGKQNLTFNNKPISTDMAEIVKNMLISNLEVWTLMNQQKSGRIRKGTMTSK